MTGVLTREKTQRNETEKHKEGSHGKDQSRDWSYTAQAKECLVTRSWQTQGRILS